MPAPTTTAASASAARDGHNLHLSLATLAASYESPRFEGTYQGLAATLQLDYARYSASLALPFYRLTRNGQTRAGAGDVHVATRIEVLRRDVVRFGVGGALSLPTGDASFDLGMGHPMGGVELWGQTTGKRITMGTAAGYRRALSAAASTHHDGGPAPLVDPMNRAELQAALSARYVGWSLASFGAAVSGAAPIGVQQGVARSILALDVHAPVGRSSIGVEWQVPVLGAPFSHRAILTLGIGL